MWNKKFLKETHTKKKNLVEDKVGIESGPPIGLQQISGIWKSQPLLFRNNTMKTLPDQRT